MIVVCLSVIALLALAVELVIPHVFCSICSDPGNSAANEMTIFGGAIELYVMENHALPHDLQALTAPSPRSGEPLISKISHDPWGNAYRYRVEDAATLTYEIRSAGLDERFGTDDDLVHPERAPR